MTLRAPCFLGTLLLCLPAVSQLSIGAGTAVAAAGTVNVVSLGNVENRSSQADLRQWNLQLAGINQSLLSTAPVNLNSLAINGGGVKTLTGIWTVNALTLTDGLLAPQSGSRFTYTGAEPVEGSENSYVSGPFYYRRNSSGRHFYPIGTANAYYPASLDPVPADVTLGMSVNAANALLTRDPTDAELEEISPARYWRLDVGQGSAPSATLAVSTRDTDDFFQARSAVLVEAIAEGGRARNLSTQSSTQGFISSGRPISEDARVFTFARLNTLIPPQIHNAITPNNDGVNDFLVIRDIRFYATDNKVTLLDRWGVIVKEWVNFRGFDPITNPPDFDFSQLSNGNYICTIEYQRNGERENVRQMITVIK